MYEKVKAIGRYIIISEIKEDIKKTDGGLLLAENHREDIRYRTADVKSVGTAVNGVNENDKIYYDRHAGHKIEVDKKSYHVIKSGDIVVVL